MAMQKPTDILYVCPCLGFVGRECTQNCWCLSVIHCIVFLPAIVQTFGITFQAPSLHLSPPRGLFGSFDKNSYTACDRRFQRSLEIVS